MIPGVDDEHRQDVFCTSHGVHTLVKFLKNREANRFHGEHARSKVMAQLVKPEWGTPIGNLSEKLVVQTETSSANTIRASRSI